LHLKKSLILFLAISTLTAVALAPKVSLMHLSDTSSRRSEETFKIQKAINDANDGDVIEIPSGVYYEHVLVNKTVSLVGENTSTTIVDGSNNGTVLEITADNVTVRNLTIQNSGYGWERRGIYVIRANNVVIADNRLHYNCQNIWLDCSHNSTVTGNTVDYECYGIRIMNCVNSTVTGNNVSNCYGGVHLENATECTVKSNYMTRNGQGIRLYSPCTYNKVFENTMFNNTYDGMISIMPGNSTLTNNSIFHNNFINNMYPFIYDLFGNAWDNGYPSGGNYWSHYNGTDHYSGLYQNETNPDGIGDTQYAVSPFEKDRYPLMHPYGSVQNLDTGIIHLAIQQAIDSPNTQSGHTIFVKNGIYNEHVVANKTLSLVGENQTMTIIDGEGQGTVLTVKSGNVRITGFTVRNSGIEAPPYGDDCGILLDHCSGSSICCNVITGNRVGLYSYYSWNATIEQNTIQSNTEDGLCLWYSGNNVLTENCIFNNRHNFGVFGNDLPTFNNTIGTSNTVDGKPILYKLNTNDETIDNSEDAGTLYLINCRNVTVHDLSLERNSHGVFCFNVTNSEIENVTANGNKYGICLQDSEGNTVCDSKCYENWVNIQIQGSLNNTVSGNQLVAGEKGISLYEANNNTLERNTIMNATYGIRLFYSNINRMFHNNLVNNSVQADPLYSAQNSWDNDLEGNYWSSYLGTDNDNDGIGDLNHTIDDFNKDRYPLFGVYSEIRVQSGLNVTQIGVTSNSTLLSLAYEPSNRTIILTVNGTDGTIGFCRMGIPYTLIYSSITVMIDDGLTEVLCPNYTLHDDGLCRWIYFAFSHSTHRITVVPEFSILTPLLVLALAMFYTVVSKKVRSSCEA